MLFIDHDVAPLQDGVTPMDAAVKEGRNELHEALVNHKFAALRILI